jgi:hypothetical protein
MRVLWTVRDKVHGVFILWLNLSFIILKIIWLSFEHSILIVINVNQEDCTGSKQQQLGTEVFA